MLQIKNSLSWSKQNFNEFAAIIVGNDLAGAVIARKIASEWGKQVLILTFDNQPTYSSSLNDFDGQIKSNIYWQHDYILDFISKKHHLGYDFISQFGQLQPIKVTKSIQLTNGLQLSWPVSLDWVKLFLPGSFAKIKQKILKFAKNSSKISISELMNHSDNSLQELGIYLYDNFVSDYCQKFWGCDFELLDEKIQDTFSLSLKNNLNELIDFDCLITPYQEFLSKILHHPKIKQETWSNDLMKITFDKINSHILINNQKYIGFLIWTKEIDQLFDYCYDQLEYRTSYYQFHDLSPNEWILPTTEVIFLNPTLKQWKILDLQQIYSFNPTLISDKKLIVYQFINNFNSNLFSNDLWIFPVLTVQNSQRYHKYQQMANQFANLKLAGNVATFDDCDLTSNVEKALNIFNHLNQT